MYFNKLHWSFVPRRDLRMEKVKLFRGFLDSTEFTRILFFHLVTVTGRCLCGKSNYCPPPPLIIQPLLRKT